MCGRFALGIPKKNLAEWLEADLPDYAPRHNIPPGTDVLAVIMDNGENGWEAFSAGDSCRFGPTPASPGGPSTPGPKGCSTSLFSARPRGPGAAWFRRRDSSSGNGGTAASGPST